MTIHTKFNIPTNRVGALLTLDQILVNFEQAKLLLDKVKGIHVSLKVESSCVYLTVKDDLSYMEISQHHMHPQALVYRELARPSQVKTPSPERLVQLVKMYFL